MLTGAIEDGLLARSPAARARMPRPDREPARALTEAQIEALAHAAPPWFTVTIALGAGAGLRQGETAGLTLDRIDFLRRTLTVDRQLVTPTRGAPELAPPKTKGSYRGVPLADIVVAALSEHVRVHGTGDHGLLLHRHGRPIGRNRFGDAWRRAARAADLEGVRHHDLRHTHASTLLSAGVSIAAVASWLGHDSPTTTLRSYAHFMPADADRGRQAIEAAFARRAEDWLRTAEG